MIPPGSRRFPGGTHQGLPCAVEPGSLREAAPRREAAHLHPRLALPLGQGCARDVGQGL